jgi:hypothetical protein
MILKPLAVAAALSSLTLTMGCEKAQEQQTKANVAQAKANTTISEVGREADDKMREAQAKADTKIADAQATFMTMREDYRHNSTTELVDFDKKLSELEAKANSAKGKDRTERTATVSQLRTGRDAFIADSKAIETASATTWDATKARLDKQWAELKAIADKA